MLFIYLEVSSTTQNNDVMNINLEGSCFKIRSETKLARNLRHNLDGGGDI